MEEEKRGKKNKEKKVEKKRMKINEETKQGKLRNKMRKINKINEELCEDIYKWRLMLECIDIRVL